MSPDDGVHTLASHTEELRDLRNPDQLVRHLTTVALTYDNITDTVVN
jgi:hypothetical protein